MTESNKFFLLITFDNWGYNQYIADALEAKSHTVKHINFHQFEYKYPNLWHKVFNFFIKNLGITNLKHLHYHKLILKELDTIDKIDTTIYIKADFLSPKTIKAINKKSQKISFDYQRFYQQISENKKILNLFDKIFSFEKKDCQKYNLRFKTNFIYKYIEEKKSHLKYKVFNISSFDKRFPVFEKIGKCLKEMNLNYKIIIFTSKKDDDPYLEFSKKPLSIPEINNIMQDSEILLDIHRNEQQGLSFRVFESLGFHKKLITTNQDIVNYDFYDARNIFVINDIENPDIPKSFLTTSYINPSKELIDNYLVENWVNELID